MPHAESSNPSDRTRDEQPAVRTTIVGSRPPGPDKAVGDIPRGIEVLVKKASVDRAFRAKLLAERASAAGDIGLELTGAEAAMLKAIPQAQLTAIINRTQVAPESLGAFLGKAAAAMLLALGLSVSGCDDPERNTAGDRPDYPPSARQSQRDGRAKEPTDPINSDHIKKVATSQPSPTDGIRPDRPPNPSRGISPDRPSKK